jgi:hypothetical protein
VQTNELLQAILDELRSRNQPLGFGHPPKPRYIYANRQYSDCLWYFWNGAQSEHEQIEHHALTGIIEKLEVEEKEFRGKPDYKVNLHMRADRAYVIQSGHDTLFARGLIWMLSKIPVAAFRQPITVAVEAGDTEQVLFCRIYNPATGEAVFAPYPEVVNWGQVTQTAIDKIQQAHNKISQAPAQQVELKPVPEKLDLSDAISAIPVEMERIGWTKKQGSAYLQETYGKKTRAELDDDEMFEFLDYLKSLPTRTKVA